MSMSMRKALAQEPTGTMYEEQERQKMLRLNHEIREPKEPRLEWIYSGDKSQSEDYLLGKKFDADAKTNPTFEESAATSTIDLANKIREDPLFLIKKQELEQQKRLLENPVRLRQIKDFLEQQESKRSSSHKKRRHNSRSRSRSPASSSRHQRHHHHHHHRRSRSRSHSPRREHRRRTPPRRPEPKRPEKLSRDERDRRMQQMLKDGVARTEQRRENVRKFKEHDDAEEKINERIKEKARKQNDLSSSDDDETDFIRPMMKQVVDDPSLKRRDLKHHYSSKKR